MNQYQTRLASKISYYLPKARTSYGKFNIRFFGAKVWNSIDDSLKSKSLFLLQKSLKRIDYIQLLTGTLMYFIFIFLRAHPLFFFFCFCSLCVCVCIFYTL